MLYLSFKTNYEPMKLFKAKSKKALALICFSLLIISSYAQNGSIKGFVYEKKSGEPVIFTNVYLEGTSIGSATDVNGYFNISRVPAGNYQLVVSYVGYDSLKQVVKVAPNKTANLKLFLKESSVKLEEFVVSAERQELKKAVYASITKVTPKQIAKLPSVGAVPDLAQYLQIVPGVVFTGDQGGQLYIRGGSPIQNKVLLDGMIIYNPFHSIGLFSVFDYDIIRNADIFTGGFNANYAGRISSVMDITTRDGNKKQFSGKLSGDTFGGKLLVEGPLLKQKENGKGSISYVLSYKSSFLEQSSKTLYKYVTEEGIPFGFNDLYGKLSFNTKSGSKFNVFGFNFKDNVNRYFGLSNLNWVSNGLGSNFVIVPNTGDMIVKGNVAYSDYGIEMQAADAKERFSKITGFNMGLDFTYFLGDNKLDYGFEINNFRTDFKYYNSLGSLYDKGQSTSELGAYFVYKINLKRLIFEPGLRVQYYGSLGETSVEPRMGLKYKITDRIRFKAAAGMYSQNLIAANSDKDVVNLFYGFLSGPENLQEEFNGKEVTTILQKSNHLIGGFEFDINSHFSLNLEGYYKDNGQITELNRNKSMADDSDNSSVNYLLKKDFILESGKAYGADILFKYDHKRLYIWTVYSYGIVNRLGEFIDGNEIVIKEYSPHYDRRHNVNLMLSYTLGEEMDWEFSARWNYGSAFPFTPNAGFYGIQRYNHLYNVNHTTQNEDLGIFLGEINSKRMSDYHRMDITIKKKFFVGDEGEIVISGNVTNIYDRKNIFYADYTSAKKVYQLPILPSIGASWKF
jgi:hypothetical protein